MCELQLSAQCHGSPLMHPEKQSVAHDPYILGACVKDAMLPRTNNTAQDLWYVPVKTPKELH